MKNPTQNPCFAFTMGWPINFIQDEINRTHLLEIFIIIENIICYIKMERLNLKTLRSKAKRLELRGYLKLRKSQLIDFIVTGLDSR